jgi:virginiamycin B lyase
VLAVVLLEAWAQPAASRAAAGTASALYYETATLAGTLEIDKLNLPVRGPGTEIVSVGTSNVFGIALAGPYVFWSVQAGPRDRGAIMRASTHGRGERRLAGRIAAPASVVTVGGFVYWSDDNAIGRARLSGSHLQRRFIVLPRQKGGGVADGLATDGTYLYFSRCEDDTIGRVDLADGAVDQAFISTPVKSCPQGIAVAGTHLYWTELGSGTIGRANLDGTGADGRWLNVHTHQGPFQVVADGTHVYWTWGGVAGSPTYTGRANANRSHFDPRFLADSLYPMALAPPPR